MRRLCRWFAGYRSRAGGHRSPCSGAPAFPNAADVHFETVGKNETKIPKEGIMETQLEKIAEKSFKAAMSRFVFFAEVGKSLRTIQNELRQASRRVTAIEDALGHPRAIATHSNQTESSEVSPSGRKRLSGIMLKQIRLRKKLKICQMAHLLGVANRKYVEWERGHYLMAPWVEEEALKLSKIPMKDLHAEFPDKKHNAKSTAKISPKRTTAPAHMHRAVTKKEIRHVCNVLKLSYRQLAITLGIKYSTVTTWVFAAVQPPDKVIEKFFQLQKEANRISPATAAVDDADDGGEERRLISEEITHILNQLHWTRRQLAVHLHTKIYNVSNWMRKLSKPSPSLAKKLRVLQEAVKRGDIAPEYNGKMATPEEITLLQKKLNWSFFQLAKELHINPQRLKLLACGKTEITYRDMIKIRNLQSKVASGEIKPIVETPKFPIALIDEICKAYLFSNRDLARRMGCNEGIVWSWKRGIKSPCRRLNKQLWELWYNAPKDNFSHPTGDDIYNLRKSKGLTQVEFGKMFNVAGSTIYSWEHEQGRPNLENLRKMKEFHASGLIKSCQEKK